MKIATSSIHPLPLPFQYSLFLWYIAWVSSGESCVCIHIVFPTFFYIIFDTLKTNFSCSKASPKKENYASALRIRFVRVFCSFLSVSILMFVFWFVFLSCFREKKNLLYKVCRQEGKLLYFFSLFYFTLFPNVKR